MTDGAANMQVVQSHSAFAVALPEFVAVAEADDLETSPLLPGEQALLHPRATETRRHSFSLGRAAAHQALAILGAEPGPLLRGDHRQPLWPDGVVGSITHAAGRAMAAAAWRDDCDGIGIDLEHRDRYFSGLEKYIAFDAELEWLTSLPDERRSGATLEIFSAKESIYKAFFPRVGRFFGFTSARVERTPTGFAANLTEPLDSTYPPERTFPATVGWQDAVVLTAVVLPAREPSALPTTDLSN